MSTPVINAIDNVNDAALNTLFQAVANNATATDNLLGSNRNIDAVGKNAQAARGLGNNGGDDDVVRRALCRLTGRDPANFPNTATDIIQDGTFRGEILGDASLSGLVSGSQPGMAEIASSATLSGELAASQTAMQKVAASQTAMQEVAASQTAINQIGSNTNENITANTALNSSTAATELENSSLQQEFSSNFEEGYSASGSITDSRVLVTSNNNSGGGGTNISFENAVGPETQNDTTFIINGANVKSGNDIGPGSISFTGIQIN
jgi:hypothetical protein